MKNKNMLALVLAGVMAIVGSVSAAALNFATVADSAIANITDAIGGAGPAVISVAGLLVGVAVIIAVLKKAGR
jgi:hypothetical protein